MVPFLKQVANHYYTSGPVEDKCFVFPNRRSIVFFTEYLKEAVADRSLTPYGGERRPLRMPSMLPISDFFYRAHGLETEDRVSLILELYECYREINPSAEPLDDFFSWGEVILGDFSDVDKYMTDPKQVFTNISEFKDMQDDYSYLTPEQREAVAAFISHFRDGGGMKTNAEGDGVKARFIKIWDRLYPLYVKFNARLESENRAYDGMAYRKLVNSLKSVSAADFFSAAFPGKDKFVFVGLNALNESERFTLRRMHGAGIAEFCWDYSSALLKNLRNKSSAYMKRNVEEFPQTWELDPDGLPEQEINVLSVPSSAGQAKQLPEILSRSGITGELSCSDCALVLPDESILVPVLNSIPPDIEDINVTMGYPLQSSGIWSLMHSVSMLQLHIRRRADGWYFYHNQVRSILTDSIIRESSGEEGRARADEIISAAKYYVPQSDFSGIPLLELIFRPVISDPSSTDAEQIGRLEEYQKEVLSAVAGAISGENGLKDVETEFAKRYFECVNLLEGKTLAVKPATYLRLLSSIASGESVPFSGEPLKGLQIMGPLETRALDFSTVVIFSCNEGIFPRKNVSVSFIPPELRKGFGLPTSEFKDAVLAYSFYRLIQRADRLWLVYDSRMEKMKAGEESRYIKQLEYHFRIPLKRYAARSEMRAEIETASVPKPRNIAETIRSRKLSVSAIQKYLECPAKFFYANVEMLDDDSGVAESLDKGMVGTVYHDVMQALYLGGCALSPSFSMERSDVADAVRSGRLVPLRYVDAGYISGLMKNADMIRAKIAALICSQLKTVEIGGRSLVFQEIILQYVLKTLERDLEYLKEERTDRFEIIGLELPVSWTFEGFRFGGYIDRIDCISGKKVRIIDYKTGTVTEKDMNVDDDTAEAVAEKLFMADIADRPKIALQLFLYDKYVENEKWIAGRRKVNVIYPVAGLFREPVSKLERPVCEAFADAVIPRLRALLAEMTDPEIPFRRTGRHETCSYCDFRNICGR